MRWAGHVARIRVVRNAYNTLIAKPEGKRPLERPRRRREVKREGGKGEVKSNIVPVL
jgi:hypothetical protein